MTLNIDIQVIMDSIFIILAIIDAGKAAAKLKQGNERMHIISDINESTQGTVMFSVTEKFSPAKRQWISLIVLFMVNLLNYMDR